MQDVFCQGERMNVSSVEFAFIGGTQVHKRTPWHRVLDGVPIEMNGDTPILDSAGEPIVELPPFDADIAPE